MMGYTLHINGATVVTDRLDEVTSLIEALKSRPAAPPRARVRTVPDPVLDDVEEEPRFAPMYPSWPGPGPTMGNVEPVVGLAVHDHRQLRSIAPASPTPPDWTVPLERGPTPLAPPPPAPPAAAPPSRRTLTPAEKSARSTRVSRAMRQYWARKHAARAAELAAEDDAAAALPPPPPPAEDLSAYEEAVAGPGPQPELAPAVNPLSEAARARWLRRPGDGSIQERNGKFVLICSWKSKPRYEGSFATRELAEAAALQIREARARGEEPPRFLKGERSERKPEFRETMRAAARRGWAARREEKDPAPAPAQLPPRCPRCIKVGHVESDCPRAAPAARPVVTVDLEQELSDEGTGATDTDGASPPGVSRVANPAPVPDEPDADPTDWTGLIDTPGLDAPTAPLAETTGPTLVTPPASTLIPASSLRVRATTIPIPPHNGLTRAERAEAVEYPDVDRPLSRGECKDGPRPCPFVSCSHHLYLDANPETGTIKVNFPHLEVWEMAETCSLDVADRGGITLEEIGVILNLTRERIRQVETMGLQHMKVAAGDRLGIAPERQAITIQDYAPWNGPSD